ncbi:hydroxyacid dehydrogenase [Chloroflexota bacterium]
MTYNIVVADRLSTEGIEILQAVPEFQVNPGPLNRAEALSAIAEADALIVRSATKADAELLAAAPNLKAIARAGAGVDNIDLAVAGAQGVQVMNTPGGNTIAAVEQTMGLMLALARHIPQGHQSLVEGRWDRKLYMGTQVYGKTLGIVGLGRIGQAVAVRAQAFGMTTIAADPWQPAEVFAACNTTSVTLDELFASSDYIALHAPAGEATRHMINDTTLASMKDGVRLINTARGTLIDPAALAAAIESGKVAGAAIDVYPTEPPDADYPLLGLAGVLHTPHLGASTQEAQITVAVQAAEQIRDGLLTGDYRNVVNADLLR